MLQLVYISSSVGEPAHADILATSRRNNGRDGITGLLFANGRRFLQALEGPEPAVQAAYERICADPRHRAQVVLSRRTVDAREFGPWEMAEREPGSDADAFVAQVAALVAGADAAVRATFDGMARLPRAA